MRPRLLDLFSPPRSHGWNGESGECPFCGHEWSRHDPEDGECDAHTSELHRFGVCQCGRDLGWMQEKIAKLSTAALSQIARTRKP